MTVRHDLIDTHICVCTPRVVELFVDNFDYKTKNDFIRGLLINEEVKMEEVKCHLMIEHSLMVDLVKNYKR